MRTWASIVGSASSETDSTSSTNHLQRSRASTPLDASRRYQEPATPPPPPPVASARLRRQFGTPLPSRIECLAETFPSMKLEHISESNLQTLMELNDQCFPIKYAPWFYHMIMANPQLTVLCFQEGSNKCFGAIMGRKEPVSKDGVYDVYISTVAVLPEYRGKGLASGLLQTLINKCKQDADVKMRGFQLHVHVVNQVAKTLYIKNGFNVVETIHGYYSGNLAVSEPRDAYFLTLRN
ncbi:acyl-CoA N-acyltransferase [Obelidium mucronatum]|nr:acyl-CoA N-acyltransferase [Obelidium mucronatum]